MSRRLLLSHLSLALMVLVLLEIPLGIFFADRERQRLAADVERDAVTLGSIYEDALEDPRASIDVGPAVAYGARTGARVVVVDDAGMSLIDTEDETPRNFSTRPEIQEALQGVRSVGTRPSETLGTDLLYVAVPVASGGVVHGVARLTIATSSIDERIERFWLSLGAIGLIVLGVAGLLSYTLASTVVRPVRDLTSAADRLASGDLGARIDVGDAPSELNRLAASFNEMADRLEELLASQRSFIADASHQLRTPLTALRLQLENAEAETSDPVTRADLEAGMAEVDRLSEIVGQLLSLARSEGRRVDAEPVDLSALVADRIELWRLTAEEADVRLDLDAPTGVVVSAAPGALEQVLDNLMDNAIASSPAGSAVRVALTDDGRRVRLTITDEGPGLDDEGKRQAFERFWRGDRERPGTGLGLPIVRTLTEQSGGSVGLEDGPGGGLRAVVELARP